MNTRNHQQKLETGIFLFGSIRINNDFFLVLIKADIDNVFLFYLVNTKGWITSKTSHFFLHQLTFDFPKSIECLTHTPDIEKSLKGRARGPDHVDAVLDLTGFSRNVVHCSGREPEILACIRQQLAVKTRAAGVYQHIVKIVEVVVFYETA